MERLLEYINNLNIDAEKLIALLKYDVSQPLMFNSGLFLILFVAFFFLYWIVKGVRTLRMTFVILFSLFFYHKASGTGYLILLAVCTSDYILGLLMDKASMAESHSIFWKKTIVFVNVAVNVAMLAYFKYFHLIIDSISRFATVDFRIESLLLPAGISFFTFRSISYIVDLYRGEMKACRNLLDYVFFLTFFPPLLAGPVVRAKDMLPQIKANPVTTRLMASEGIWLIALGLVKKVVIADFISGNFVERVFDNPSLYSGFENLMATFGFTIQLYCDFSGYSDMAIGMALLLGYRFRENFNAPFKAQNPTEFWHRWHISLSTWLRDYVYIPLGGNRCSRPRMYFNQFATMLIGGLWHGASWMYVIWGAVHGVLLVVHKAYRHVVKANNGESLVTEGGEMIVVEKPRNSSPLRKAVNMLLTFSAVSFTFMLFRAPSMDDVKMMWHQIFYDFHASVASQFVQSYFTIVLLMVGAYFLHLTPSNYYRRIRTAFITSSVPFQAIMLAIVIFIVIQVRQSEIVPFLYLQY